MTSAMRPTSRGDPRATTSNALPPSFCHVFQTDEYKGNKPLAFDARVLADAMHAAEEGALYVPGCAERAPLTTHERRQQLRQARTNISARP